MKISHKTEKLRDIIKLRDSIKLDPSWQRGPVWDNSRKALLIDSILRGYDVPMIYLRKTNESQPYQFEVVDGQQRLRAVWDYIDGNYSLTKDVQDINGVRIATKGFDDLTNRMKSRLRDFEIVIAYIEDAHQPAISEVFSRMQMGIRLNPAELRNATQTGLRHAIDSTARLHPFFRESRIPLARFKHQDYLAHALSVCHHGLQRDAKAPQLKDDYTHITDSEDYAPLIVAANAILDVLHNVNTRNRRRITQKWMFVDLFYFLYCNRKKIKAISKSALSSLYLKLDEDRREHNAEPDLLLEGKLTSRDRDLYDYIIAFKYSGGEKSNLQQRARVVKRRFSAPLGL